MNSPIRLHRIHASILLLPALLAAITLLPSCGAPQEPAAGQAPAETNATQETDGAGETAATAEDAPGAGEMAANSVETSDEGTVAIEPPEEPVGDKLPEVKEVDTKQLAEVVASATGKVTVLNIWATWCGPCVHEMPDLVKFYNATDREELAFISLSIDDVAEISGAIPDFQRDFNIPFPIYVLNERDDEGMVKALRGEFEGVIPVTYFYDREGKLVETVLGAVTLAELHEKVQPLLEPDSAP